MIQSFLLRIFSVLAVAMAIPGGDAAAQARAASPLAVVELFTSQGCSSCPPADALLGELARRSDVLALAFHVDYWDRLGWRDPFGLPLSAERQRRYVGTLGLASAFTPQSIVDGRISVVGSDRRRLLAAIGTKRVSVPVNLSASDGRVLIALDASPDHARLGARHDVLAIAYLPEASTVIARGENAGRTLTEFNIVRAVHHVGTWDGHSARFSLSVASLPGDASKLAVLLQGAGQGPVAGAATMKLR